MNITASTPAMDIDLPEYPSYTHRWGTGATAHAYSRDTSRHQAPNHRNLLGTAGPSQTPWPYNLTPRSVPAPPSTLHTPTPRRRTGGGHAVQCQAYGTPSPTPSPEPRATDGGSRWRESADALQEDIAAQFEAEDRRAAGVSKRKREGDRPLDDVVAWLVETGKRRRQ